MCHLYESSCHHPPRPYSPPPSRWSTDSSLPPGSAGTTGYSDVSSVQEIPRPHSPPRQSRWSSDSSHQPYSTRTSGYSDVSSVQEIPRPHSPPGQSRWSSDSSHQPYSTRTSGYSDVSSVQEIARPQSPPGHPALRRSSRTRRPPPLSLPQSTWSTDSSLRASSPRRSSGYSGVTSPVNEIIGQTQPPPPNESRWSADSSLAPSSPQALRSSGYSGVSSANVRSPGRNDRSWFNDSSAQSSPRVTRGRDSRPPVSFYNTDTTGSSATRTSSRNRRSSRTRDSDSRRSSHAAPVQETRPESPPPPPYQPTSQTYYNYESEGEDPYGYY